MSIGSLQGDVGSVHSTHIINQAVKFSSCSIADLNGTVRQSCLYLITNNNCCTCIRADYGVNVVVKVDRNTLGDYDSFTFLDILQQNNGVTLDCSFDSCMERIVVLVINSCN